MKKKHKIVIAMTGASGAIYSKVLIDKLISIKDQIIVSISNRTYSKFY